MSKETRRNIRSSKATPERDVDIAATYNESGLARWSRRKAEAKQHTPGRDEEVPDDSLQVPVDNEKPGDESIAYPTDQDMPPLESLDEHSDYSGFFSPGVSEKLRKQALRKLFHLDLYNVTDGLDDYAEDYTKFAPLGNILTADMRLQQERAEKLAKAESLTTETDPGKDELTESSHGNLTEQARTPGNENPEKETKEAEGINKADSVPQDQV